MKMQHLYQKGPSNVPVNFTNPTKSFKRHVIIATLSLFFFVVIYTFLMVWFAILAFDLFSALARGGVDNPIFNIVTGICLAFLSIFMIKSLFIFNKNDGTFGKELKASDEPELFNYLHQLADEAGAPRPHRVFLTSRVNASVFYDLNIFNLILPTKKNLEIGLGLINVLNLGELKAVLAHEFGHFAQRSMLLGRYVYTAQQIAVRVVNKRDALDNLISGLSRIDIRVAWIGWILSILVWAVRSLIQTLFSAVAVAEKALSREMEFQADLVAVSLTGSDALIHALHKLRAADEAYNAALGTINKQLSDKKATADLFALQTNYIEKMSWILSDSSYGKSPVRVNADGSERIFSKGLVNPPEMWSTHPADNDREDNAKNTYIYADLDDRSSWDLFKDPTALRLAVTDELIQSTKLETTPLSKEESIKQMNEEEYSWTFLYPRYKGAFLKRYTMINYKTLDEAYDITIPSDFNETYQKIYTDVISDIIDKHKEISEEIGTLTMISHEVMTAEKRVIVHRGNQIKRSEIPDILVELDQEEQAIREKLILHDRQCRKVAYDAAMKLNSRVADYLKGLSGLVHYAEHSLTNLGDINGKFNNTLVVIMADGRVSSSEMTQLMAVCNEMHKVLNLIYSHRSIIKLDSHLEKKMTKPYYDMLEDFELGLANQENINSWIDAVRTWISASQETLMKLRNAALERLLDVEDQIQQATQNDTKLDIQVQEIRGVNDYDVIVPGDERELQHKLNLWDRFHMGDGLLPTLAKFTISAAIVIAALYFGNMGYEYDLHLYNGLNANIEVSVNGDKYSLSPYESAETEIVFGEEVHLVAISTEGDTIEQFTPTPEKGFTYVYNIASAGLAYHYTVSYGYDHNIANSYFGAKRWIATSADYIFTEAPSTISTSSYSSRATKTVFTIESKTDPFNLIDYIDNENDMMRMADAHVVYDEEVNGESINWLSLSAQLDTNMKALRKRLEKYPNEVISWRQLQNSIAENKKDSLCLEMGKMYDKEPNNTDYYYLKTRCIDDGIEQNNLFVQGHEKWPDNAWLSYASGFVYAGNNEWEKAYNAYGEAMIANPDLLVPGGIDFERIHRLMESEGISNERYNKILSRADNVSYFRRLESGYIEANQGDPFYAFYLLSQGKIDESMEYLSQFEEDQVIAFNWFMAASKGASDELINKVLEYDSEVGLGQSSIWVSIALRAREGKSIDDFLIKLQKIYGESSFSIETTKKFIEYVKQFEAKKAEEVLGHDMIYQYKMRHKLLGVILMGGKAPEKWKKQVNRLLFISEKPYLGIKTNLEN